MKHYLYTAYSMIYAVSPNFLKPKGYQTGFEFNT